MSIENVYQVTALQRSAMYRFLYTAQMEQRGFPICMLR